jgi:nitroimidazol reductase NimA-like FMN-containing flavoprotein (pyridoxamine 5'-phosphate oxidase superfamily)
MRRSEREITKDAELRAVLSRERVVRIAFAVENEPYVVPMSYGYDPELHALVLHTAASGRKLEFVARNPRVCFEIEGPSRLRRAERVCAWGLSYESLIGYGVLTELLTEDEKRRGLDCLMRQHAGDGSDAVVGLDLPPGVRVWRLAIESLTGKRAA